MVQKQMIEGSGEEIAKYAQAHPRDRFQLIVLSQENPKPIASKRRSGPDQKTRQHLIEFKRSLKGKMGALPLDATSTEALYD